jgi:hypothetical protein
MILVLAGCVSDHRTAPTSTGGMLPTDDYEVAVDELGRARAFADSGQTDLAPGAFARAEHALQTVPNGPRRERLAADLYRARGDFLLQTRRYDEAWQDYERALPLVTGEALNETAARLYLIAEQRGDQKSMETYARLLGSPTHPAVTMTRAKFKLEPPVARAAPAPHETDDTGLNVLSRKDWRARPARRDREEPMTEITRITVHHSGDHYVDTGRPEAAATIFDMQGVHQQRDWADIGYHFVIDPAGRVWRGREITFQGAHAGNPALNRGNIGICLLGNFDEQQVPRKQREALIELIDRLRAQYHVSADNVYTHSEMRKSGNLTATACPGHNLQSIVEAYRGGVALSSVPSSAASTRMRRPASRQ